MRARAVARPRRARSPFRRVLMAAAAMTAAATTAAAATAAATPIAAGTGAPADPGPAAPPPPAAPSPPPPAAPGPLKVGFAQVDLTPAVDGGRPVWLAGYGHGRRATGVHDPIFARCVVLEHGGERIALVSADLVGLQYPEVLRVRERLAAAAAAAGEGAPSFRHVLVASTHNHEGPDVVGIWGRTPLQSGLDPAYLNRVVAGIAEGVTRAAATAAPAEAHYGKAEDETLLNDSRRPVVYDAVLRTLRFTRPGGGADAPTTGLLVQWNCHPEVLGSKNTEVTADFVADTVAALEERYGCPVALFTGAVGGLMAPPRRRFHDAEGNPLPGSTFAYCAAYGKAVAGLAARAAGADAPIRLTPFAVAAREVVIPVDNLYYRTAFALGVLGRPARVWTGNPDKPGPPLTAETADAPMAVVTEVGYLRLGELEVAGIPGELYPELVYGQFEDPADPGADFPDAALEPTVTGVLRGERWLLFGLANDEIGYLIPERQWDAVAPFAYGRKTAQYGEINSCGPGTAGIVMRALAARVRELR